MKVARVFVMASALLASGCWKRHEVALSNVHPSHWEVVPAQEIGAGPLRSFTTWRAHLATIRDFVSRHGALPISDSDPDWTKEMLEDTLAGLEALSTGDEGEFWRALGEHFYVLRLAPQEAAFFTGYYTMELPARLKPDAEFKIPIYGPPADLVANGPTYNRVAIDRDGLLAGKGLEIAWLRDPLDAYFLHVQGSATLLLPRGEKLGVGVANTNHMEYVSLGRLLVKEGRISAADISLFSIRDFFKAHPEELNNYIWRNPRYVFFQKSDGIPRGSLGAPVMAFHSAAVERYRGVMYRFPPLLPLILDLPEPKGQGRFSCLVFSQDTGSAITGDNRFDLYTGVGSEAEKIAGVLKHQGSAMALWPKSAGIPTWLAGLQVKSRPERPATSWFSNRR